MPRFTGLQAAIVDLDGTLIDTLGDFVAALNAALGELSLPPLPAATVERLVGKGSDYLVRSALREAGGDEALYEAAWSAYQRHYGEVNGRHATVYRRRAARLASAARCRPAAGLRDQQANRLCPRVAAAEGPAAVLRPRVRRRCVRAQEARSAAAAGSLPGPGLGAGAHAGDRRFGQRRGGCARGRLPGAAGRLRLQPRPAGPGRRRRRLPRLAGRSRGSGSNRPCPAGRP